MYKKYTYKLRPAYDSTELLFEFIKTGVVDDFVKELVCILESNGFECFNFTDVWMNNEIWIHLKSACGTIIITKDIWDLIFILYKGNQTDILKIDEILLETGLFRSM